MRSFRIALAAAVFAALFTFAAAPARAEDPLTKLGRGVANILTGWVEIPKTVYNMSVEQNPFKGLTVGLLKGTGEAFHRTGAGIYDAATFPIAVPANYESPIDPEYVF